jgi:hypothetical protein
MALVNTWRFQCLTLHITNYTPVTFGAEGLSLFLKNKILFLVIYIKNQLCDNYAQILEEKKNATKNITSLLNQMYCKGTVLAEPIKVLFYF